MGPCTSWQVRNTGLVRNQSQFIVVYCVFDKVEKIQNEKVTKTIDPNISLDTMKGKFTLNGFSLKNQVINKPKYVYSAVQLLPGKHSSLGLRNLEPCKNMWSLYIVVGKYVKFLFQDVVIHCVQDSRIKIRSDLAIKDLCLAQTAKYFRLNQEVAEYQEFNQADVQGDDSDNGPQLFIDRPGQSNPNNEKRPKKKIKTNNFQKSIQQMIEQAQKKQKKSDLKQSKEQTLLNTIVTQSFKNN